MYKHVFFDLDGTITEPQEGIIGGVVYALEKFGIAVEDRKTLFPYIGPPLRVSFAEFHGLKEEQTEQAVSYYREYYSTKGILQNEIMPGMKEALAMLKEAGCQLYVATSKPELYAKQILEHLGLIDYFEIVAGSSFDKSRDSKEAVLAWLLEQLEVRDAKRSDIVMVGDRKFDVLGAKQFGIDQIGVLFGYGSKEEFEACGCMYLVQDAKSMVDIILK